MWKKAEIEVLRDVDPGAVMPFHSADAVDGIMLNHGYVDMRGIDIADAILRLNRCHVCPSSQEAWIATMCRLLAMGMRICGPCGLPTT